MKKIYFSFFFGFTIAISDAQITQIIVVPNIHKPTLIHFLSLKVGTWLGMNINKLSFFQKYHKTEGTFFKEAGLQLSFQEKYKMPLTNE